MEFIFIVENGSDDEFVGCEDPIYLESDEPLEESFSEVAMIMRVNEN